MTSKEALETIGMTKTNNIKSESLSKPRVMYLVKELRNKEIQTIKQDLERLEKFKQKETPMKAVVYNINQYKCPKCLNQIKGKKMIYNMKTKKFDIKSKIKVEKVYCPYCSQKLDWSDCND